MKKKILKIILLSISISGITYAIPASTVHRKIINIGQIEFLDKSKANNGQKIIGSITTPMIYNGLYTQDIGSIILSNDYLFGSPTSIFQNQKDTLDTMDFVGYEIAVREYSKAIKNIRLVCSADPVYKTKKETVCKQTERADRCWTVTTKGLPCNEHLKTFENYLSNDYLAPDVESYQVCIANCGNSNQTNEHSGGDGGRNR